MSVIWKAEQQNVTCSRHYLSYLTVLWDLIRYTDYFQDIISLIFVAWQSELNKYRNLNSPLFISKLEEDMYTYFHTPTIPRWRRWWKVRKVEVIPKSYKHSDINSGSQITNLWNVLITSKMTVCEQSAKKCH